MKEYLRGGKGDGIPRSKFPKKQLRMGRKVEREHSTNPRIAEEIARDHLSEFKDYYSRLARMERMAKREGVKGVKESLREAMIKTCGFSNIKIPEKFCGLPWEAKKAWARSANAEDALNSSPRGARFRAYRKMYIASTQRYPSPSPEGSNKRFKRIQNYFYKKQGQPAYESNCIRVVGISLIEATLTGSARKRVKPGNFALPGRRYPIHDAAHARNALARVAQHGTAEEKAAVRAAVARRYKGIMQESRVPLRELSAGTYLRASSIAQAKGKPEQAAKFKRKLFPARGGLAARMPAKEQKPSVVQAWRNKVNAARGRVA